VRGVDESVATLVATLDELGLAEDTVVIYSSDQGFYLGERGWYDKRWMYENSFEMPLIIRWPGVVKPGSRNKHLVQNLDHAPTFLEMAGAAIPADYQGQSLVPLLKGRDDMPWRDALYYHYYEHPGFHMVERHRGVSDGRYKLMHFYRFNEWEFYDLQNDPGEQTNQYANPQLADQVSRMKTKLDALAKQYRDNTDIAEIPAEEKRRIRPGEWE
jgi:arylsulfatase A-like enzyme